MIVPGSNHHETDSKIVPMFMTTLSSNDPNLCICRGYYGQLIPLA